MADGKGVGRHVADRWCGEVLGVLSDYVDGDLDAAEVAAVEAHLRGCDWCEQFGGAFAGVVTRLRAELLQPIDPGVSKRLADRLDALID